MTQPDTDVAQYKTRILITSAAAYVREQVSEHIRVHQLPGPVVIEGRIWVPTGLWRFTSIEISGGNRVLLRAEMVWRSTEGKTCTNPLGSPGIPPGFRFDFKLPHELEVRADLTETPTTQGEHRWVTGFAPGIPQEHHSVVLQLIREALQQERWNADSV